MQTLHMYICTYFGFTFDTMLSAKKLWEYCRTCLVKLEKTSAEANYKSVSINEFPDLRNLMHACLRNSAVDEDSLCKYAPFICRSCFDKWSEFSELHYIAIKAAEEIRKLLKKGIPKGAAVFEESCSIIPDEEKSEYLLNMENSITENNIKVNTTNSPLFDNQLTNVNLCCKRRENPTDDSIQPDNQQNSNSPKFVLQSNEDYRCCSYSDTINECAFSAEIKKKDEKIKNEERIKNTKNQRAFKSPYKTRNATLKPSDKNIPPKRENKIMFGYCDNSTKRVRFECKECTKYFWEKNKYDGHMKQVHEGIRRPYECQQCDKSYNLYKTLLQHKRDCHSEKNQEAFKCEQCNKVFKTGIILKQHLNNKHSERKESTRSICDQCGFIAAHQYSLTRHIINRHTESNQIKCDQCPKVFKTRYSLKYHVIGNHNLSNIKPFKCTECQMEFTRKTLLNQHKRTHLKYTERIKCDFEGCKVRFVKRGDKTHHIRLVHLKIKQHICDFCGEAFGALQTLRHHRFIHTGEKPYKCNVCGQGFRQCTAMKTHRKIHFGKEVEMHDLINNLPETNLGLLNNFI